MYKEERKTYGKKTVSSSLLEIYFQFALYQKGNICKAFGILDVIFLLIVNI